MSIPIGVVGKIRNGDHSEMCVRVEDDTKSTGGYLVYQWWKNSNGPNTGGAFDDWVESKQQLDEYFAATGWSIDWEQADIR
jgi:hypothetical protein